VNENLNQLFMRSFKFARLGVNIARRQLAEWARGGGKALSAIAEEGKANRTKIKQRYAPVRLKVPPDTLESARNSHYSRKEIWGLASKDLHRIKPTGEDARFTLWRGRPRLRPSVDRSRGSDVYL
jgi:hypothetical protein